MILRQIVQVVEGRVQERMRRRPLSAVERAAADAEVARGFAAAVAAGEGGMGLIAELKKASPSAGVIREDFDVGELSVALARGGANALSVLTEADHFQGSLDSLEVAAHAGLPCLQKDFVLHEYQILEGRAAGADAVLLIAEALEAARAEQLCTLALDLGMDVLFESHDVAHTRRAATRAERDPERVLVGINNRDLRTFEVSLDVTRRALDELPKGLLPAHRQRERHSHGRGRAWLARCRCTRHSRGRVVDACRGRRARGADALERRPRDVRLKLP
jgi:indole-3-glycerol phosphate synthase